jgi:hypothetical protein
VIIDAKLSLVILQDRNNRLEIAKVVYLSFQFEVLSRGGQWRIASGLAGHARHEVMTIQCH